MYASLIRRNPLCGFNECLFQNLAFAVRALRRRLQNVIRHVRIGAGDPIKDVIARYLSALWIAAFTRFEAMEHLNVFQAELGDILDRSFCAGASIPLLTINVVVDDLIFTLEELGLFHLRTACLMMNQNHSNTDTECAVTSLR
jgi:hypothetical protein